MFKVVAMNVHFQLLVELKGGAPVVYCKAIANAKAAISVPKVEELIKVGIDWHAPAVKSSD